MQIHSGRNSSVDERPTVHSYTSTPQMGSPSTSNVWLQDGMPASFLHPASNVSILRWSAHPGTCIHLHSFQFSFPTQFLWGLLANE